MIKIILKYLIRKIKLLLGILNLIVTLCFLFLLAIFWTEKAENILWLDMNINID